MASELIVDLAAIDLSQVMADAEAVGRVNPQCGPMRQLDHVVWHDELLTCGVGVKHIGPDEFWLPYHVPGRPLMPGVLMI